MRAKIYYTRDGAEVETNFETNYDFVRFIFRNGAMKICPSCNQGEEEVDICVYNDYDD